MASTERERAAGVEDLRTAEPARTLDPFEPRKRKDLSCLVEGCAICVRLSTGQMVVGEVIGTAPGCVVLMPWGTGREVRVYLADVEACRVVGAHTWAERQEVGQRQRAGLSAVP